MEIINYTSPFNKNISFDLAWDSTTFKPTATSDFLIKAICENTPETTEDVLDLGCGIGVVGIALLKHKIAMRLSASDLSADAVSFTQHNCNLNDLEVDTRISDIFSDWTNSKFDIIANDISGIAEDVAKASSWFDNVPSNSGPDGTDHVIKVIQQANNHLKKNGILYFPVISLSNTNKIIETARNEFETVTKLSSNSWFMPEALAHDIRFLEEQAAQFNIDYDEKFGKVICYTDIYSAQ
tara:strand:+ start:3039 stop:3755 length:717 start_codon:yes stop_codon:yes gene_type:complete